MDRKTMSEIYGRTKATVYRVAYTYCRNVQDAEDVTQEVFLTRFSKDIAFPNEGEEKAWLIRVTINKCKNLLKSFRRTHSTSLEDVGELCVTPRENDVMTAVNSLSDKYRIVICLYYVEGYPISDISGILGIPKSTVQTRLQRAREQLKRLLKEDF